MKFLFGPYEGTPRPDKSIIFKQHFEGSHHVMTVDLSKLQTLLDTTQPTTAEEIAKVVAYSVWRAQSWNIIPMEQTLEK
jgi:3-dehydroquinate synthase class II